MKRGNDPAKSNHYRAYNDSKPTYIREKEVIESIPESHWWIREYLKTAYRFPK